MYISDYSNLIHKPMKLSKYPNSYINFYAIFGLVCVTTNSR